ncbi:MAG TPA: DUF3313 domain-containing protein [Burkholderiaceae bacterium]|nr:DUF3313 domain-containing protein [Burkholderiaceae bacterium]
MRKSRSLAILFILALIAGCQSGPSETSAAGAQGAAVLKPVSGFLGDYSQLKPVPDREGVMLYIDRSADYRPFTKIMFDPVQVYVAPSPDQAQLAPDVAALFNTNAMASFRKELEPKYHVVTAPGPDVLRVRTAITGIQPVKPERGISDYIPIKALVNVGREAAGIGRRVVEMTAEMEVLDPNGKRLVAATATRKGDKALPQGERVTWSQLSSITDYWAKGFRQRLDELRRDPSSPATAGPR